MTLSASDRDQINALLGREPSAVELTIFDTMWSEHCSYKSSKEILKTYLPTKGSEVALGIGEDAGIIRFAMHDGKSYCIAISHESHNHPSQILPVEGAATGVGGVVRDVYCMGADVFGVMNSLHFGIDESGTAPLVDDIAANVVIGVSDYGNPLGVPMLGGETVYHSSYNDNCLVNVAGVGLVEESKIIRSRTPEAAKTEPYDVILFGKSTDATGFGGASFSSATLDTADDVQNIGAVQVHDPFLKRVIVEAIKAVQAKVYAQHVEIGFKDLGAGGISCATSEIAAASGFGVDVNLDDVNVAFSGLPPEVIACSETQERFCMVVPAWFSAQVLKVFNEDFELPKLYPNAGARVIGRVTTNPRYRLFSQGHCLCDLPIGAITTEVRVERTAQRREIVRQASLVPEITAEQLARYCVDVFALPNVVSKRYVYRYFDHCVQARTLLYPGEGDAVVVAPVDGCSVGLATSMDSNLYGTVDPYVSGAYAVAESVRNVVSVGARPIAITDCLNYGNPENPESFFDFVEGVKGIADAANALGFIPGEALPIISGNVSFYNDSKQGTAVVPSPVIVALGRVADYTTIRHMTITEPGLHLIVVGRRYAEFGATQLANLIPSLTGAAPQVRFAEERAQNETILSLIDSRKLAHVHDISGGGFWVALGEMVLGDRGATRVGAVLDVRPMGDALVGLFSENGGYVLAVSDVHLSGVEAVLSESGAVFYRVGRTVSGPDIELTYSDTGVVRVSLEAMCAARESRC
jgi:phosphoribosylformylglycinamidine synthase subunit PurL